ncbi:MAG: ABC transporter permease [Anaerolineales bacterium]|jgi:peptide/nickel transport system permease protein|nr:ABC transporter permease [Anaerolineales bacterium]
MKKFIRSLKEIVQYPAAMIGSIVIVFLIILSVVTVIVLPRQEAIRLWRGGDDTWQTSPKNAKPIWLNWFRREDLPKTIVVSTEDENVQRKVEIVDEEKSLKDIKYELTFDYPYQKFPQEISIFFDNKFENKSPYISATWITPDGREIKLTDFTADENHVYRFGLDSKLSRRVGGLDPHIGVFAKPDTDPPVALPGEYTLQITGLVFEENADVDAELVVYGQVHGLGGTDHRRRGIIIALLWGTPIALSFGLLAALGTTITTMIIAAFGVWYGGWVDELIQRITEIRLILPVLPILIMVGTFYSRSIWTMLGVLILLNIFGSSIKTYRAVFLQEKEAGYIEAAQAYGASNIRIIFRYLIPRIIPLMIPSLVVLIPSFVFLEASLAVLGLGDPTLPTWGKVMFDAQDNGALIEGNYYWILEPAFLLMFTGFAFAMVGFSLDRIFNPKLRGM